MGLPLFGLQAGAVLQFLDTEQPHSVALKQLKEFPAVLSSEEIEQCLDFLASRFDQKEQPLLIVRQNDLADFLLQRESTARSTANTLLAALEDADADVLWREYCLQKLPLAYEHAGDDLSLKLKLIDTLKAYCVRYETSFSGTALLGLYRLGDDAAISVDELIRFSLRILEGSKYSTANKVTALQVAALLGDASAITQARGLIADATVPVALRVSAIASIGQVGGPEDIASIERLTDDSDIRIRASSRSALRSLSAQSPNALK